MNMITIWTLSEQHSIYLSSCVHHDELHACWVTVTIGYTITMILVGISSNPSQPYIMPAWWVVERQQLGLITRDENDIVCSLSLFGLSGQSNIRQWKASNVPRLAFMRFHNFDDLLSMSPLIQIGQFRRRRKLIAGRTVHATTCCAFDRMGSNW